MVDQGGNPNSRNAVFLFYFNLHGVPCLVGAVKSGYVSVVHALLKVGADPNIEDKVRKLFF